MSRNSFVPQVVSNYLEALRENYNGQIPLGICLKLFGLPFLIATLAALIGRIVVGGQLLGALISIHGIFVSVLVASYAPFLEFLFVKGETNAKPPALTELDPLKVIQDAQQTVKRLLFAANSLSIWLSLAIIIGLSVALAIQSPVENELLPREVNLHTLSIISFLLYYAIALNLVVLFGTVRIVNDFVFRAEQKD